MFRHSATTRRLAPLACAALAGSLVAGCGASTSGSGGGSAKGPLEVWTRSDVVDAKAYKRIFAAFTKKTGIKVDYKPIVDFDKLLQQRAASKNLPDVTINDMGSLGNYQSQGCSSPSTRRRSRAPPTSPAPPGPARSAPTASSTAFRSPARPRGCTSARTGWRRSA